MHIIGHSVLIVFISLGLTTETIAGGDGGYTSIDFGVHTGLTQIKCPSDEKVEKRWCGDSPNKVNMCQRVGGYVAHLESGGSFYTCSKELTCGAGFYLSENCTCTETAASCYHESNNCRVPKTVDIGLGSCSKKDWESARPNYCSIMESKEDCEQIGAMRELAYVIDSLGKLRWLNELNIEEALIYDKAESFIQDKHLSLPGPIRGDHSYCQHFPGNEMCYRTDSDEKSPFRIFKRNGAIPHVHVNTCSSPVYCYGYKTAVVYNFKKQKTTEKCAGCMVTCSKESVHIVTSLEGATHVQVCGRTECTMLDTTSKIIDLPRSFQSKVSDERLRVILHSENRLISYDNYTTCPTMGVCEAIDCVFCSNHFLNPTCYSKFDWLMMLVGLYISMVMTGLAMTCAIPIVKLAFSFIRLASKLMIKLLKILARVGGQAVNRTRSYAEEEGEPMMEGVYAPTTVAMTRPVRSGKASVRLPLSLALICVLLLPIVMAKAPCSSVLVDTIQAESCSLKGDSYHCTISSINEVPLISYDQTTCLTYLTPGGQNLGQLQITPLDISFKCSKQGLYYTRDFEMVSDHVVRCPRAGPCTPDWCHSVNSETQIPDLADLNYPSHKSCKLGDACWGNGCFFCTSSCHVIRYYAKPKTDLVYELYTCPKWDPSGSFHLLWESNNGNVESTISLIHGETKQFTTDMSVTLDVEIQSKLPILGKTFISDGSRVAISDSSFLGQPIAGELGQVQCHSSEKAAKMQQCSMAPNICVCRPEASDDGCDCAQVYIDKIFSSSAVLPVSVDNYHLEMNRDIPYLKTPAFGSGHIKVRSSMRLIGTAVPAETCSVSLEKMSGCYSCVSGALLEYKCSTEQQHTVVASCSGDIHLILECDNTGSMKKVRFQSPTPLITLQCEAPCSRTGFSLTGTLVRMGSPDLSSQGHINLIPGAAREEVSSWLMQCWVLLGWYNLLWLIGVAILVLLLIMALRSRAGPTHIIKYIKSS